MSSVQEIEETIRKLGEHDLAAFRDWFAAFDAEAWDRQLARDWRRDGWTASRKGRCAI